MTLQERMNAMKETFERTLSAEKRDIRYRATEDLRRSGILDRVIKVGAPIPEFTLPNARGEKVSSADLHSRGPLVAVSPMREPYLRKMAEKNHLEFDLLRDEGNVVSAKFGLVFRLPDDLIELYKTFGADLVRFNGDDSWTLPMPARFVIDQKGILWHADVNADYTVRPDPSETIAVLKNPRV